MPHLFEERPAMDVNSPVLRIDPERTLVERRVNMSNALTRAAHALHLAEKRLIACALAKGDSMPLLPRDAAWSVRVTAAEYAEAFGLSQTTAYEQLSASAATLFERYIRYFDETPKGPKEVRFRWVEKAVYHQGEGWVELLWTRTIGPHVFGLRGQFTTYKLKQAAALRSIYSWRLFECFRSWAGTGVYAPELAEFHDVMECSPGQRANFRDLKKRVIDPAVAELTEKCGLVVEWRTENKGRKVVGLVFRFGVNPQKTDVDPEFDHHTFPEVDPETGKVLAIPAPENGN
jgi:plasmid replication initiation protein